jgi:multimeric flavodoxin WrbA
MRLMLYTLRDIPSTIMIVWMYMYICMGLVCAHAYMHMYMECSETEGRRTGGGKRKTKSAHCKLKTRVVQNA